MTHKKSIRRSDLVLLKGLLPFPLPQTLLVVRSASPDVDLCLVFFQLVLCLIDGPDDALQGVGHVGEVGNATADD